MESRWMVERKYIKDKKIMQIVEVYCPDENEELVEKENKQWSYNKELIEIGN